MPCLQKLERATTTVDVPKTLLKCQSLSDQGSLHRRRDFAQQRWPCGLHKMAVWRLAPTAAPRIPRVNLPMVASFGLGSRRGICVYHRRCGTTSSARRERPLVHIRTRICAGDPVPLKPATLLPSSPTICRSGILKWLGRGIEPKPGALSDPDRSTPRPKAAVRHRHPTDLASRRRWSSRHRTRRAE